MLPNHRPRWGQLDTVLLLLLLCALGYLGMRIHTGLEYRWNWQVIPQYLVRYDPVDGWVPNLLILGLFTTIRLSFWSLLLALPIGVIAGLMRTSNHLFNRLVGGTYVTLLRNLPPLVLIFIFYFFISDQILPFLNLGEWVLAAPHWLQQVATLLLAPSDQLEAFIAAIITLALFEAAYIGEIVRAGINGVETGQWEAGRALGMRRWQVLQSVVMPQAFQRMIPPLAGQAISTIKDSAIVSVISIQELTFQGMELMAATYLTFEVWITVTVLYLLLTYSCSWLAGKLELRLQRTSPS
ncbi:amino acid ABC transporter membrane protein 2, PAAT family [Desulfuromusa kysingii]|uniref:Amino acid ABC transporter membrane protein 2, PAAT family n=1 Tax=Desulfuromusa kysingii TaxID=37625 RepID=A0A1H4APR3_9BACT|nr:amino acid ABC transporter permease [Desulfuromusa kysingii]SEA37712.1 amino acid ABC transporter membrane protein 2, PAAT family [Desulfuromusa kysingii]